MKKILLVEDDMIIAHFLKKILQSLGYDRTEVIAYGEEVLDKVGQMSPEMILMDIMLRGDKDGIEAAAEVAAEYSEVSIIFLTGNTDKATRERALKAGATGFLNKPIVKSQLRDMLDEQFGVAPESRE